MRASWWFLAPPCVRQSPPRVAGGVAVVGGWGAARFKVALNRAEGVAGVGEQSVPVVLWAGHKQQSVPAL